MPNQNFVNAFVLKDMNITVVTGTSVTIVTQTFTPVDYHDYLLIIGQEIGAVTGTEPVFIMAGTGGLTYPLIDNAGNVVVSGKLRGGQFVYPGNIVGSKYQLQFGSNGLPSAIPHFVVHRGLNCMIYNGTAGALDAQTP